MSKKKEMLAWAVINAEGELSAAFPGRQEARDSRLDGEKVVRVALTIKK